MSCELEAPPGREASEEKGLSRLVKLASVESTLYLARAELERSRETERSRQVVEDLKRDLAASRALIGYGEGGPVKEEHTCVSNAAGVIVLVIINSNISYWIYVVKAATTRAKYACHMETSVSSVLTLSSPPPP